MTIYGSPGGTPLNQTGGFQGTQPGNAVQATLQVVNPGVGLFPPNSNTNSGDSIMASISRGACPANVNVTNFGATAHSGLGTGAAGGRPLLEALCDGDSNGVSPTFTANGGSVNLGAAGGNSLGAGGLSQTTAPSSGEGVILPANAPASMPAIPAQPVYRG
jgi:hypothetical protein